ncbi:MAG: hypothetical protein J6X62_01360 [Bacteroidales bacterium]|nr:hypothetical protein [Bacteroidales bacterium]
MKRISALLFIALFVGIGINANAQLEKSLYLNLGLPTGDFGENNKNPLNVHPMGKTYMGNNAAIGFGVGARVSYFFDIGYGEVAPFVGLDMLWNPLKKDLRIDYVEDDNCKRPQYWNIPLTVGVTYRYALDRIIMPYAEFGVGYDIFSVTAEGFHNVAGKQYFKYSPTGQVMLQIGGGTYLGEYVSIGLNYYHMGLHVVEYTKSSDRPALTVSGQPEPVKHVQVGLLLFRIGFHF